MQLSKFFIGLALSLTLAQAQVGRIELLTRSAAHPARRGSGSDVAAPEVSGDGRFVLFLSAGPNSFSNNVPASAVPNLYLMDRQNGAVELVSGGFDGLPANDGVVNFQMSASGRRVYLKRGLQTSPRTIRTERQTSLFVIWICGRPSL
jgi:hypothetical protein